MSKRERDFLARDEAFARDEAKPPKRYHPGAHTDGGGPARGANWIDTDGAEISGDSEAAESNSIETHEAHTQSAADGDGPLTSPALTVEDSTSPLTHDPAPAQAHADARAAEVERNQGEHVRLGQEVGRHYEHHATVSNMLERQVPDQTHVRAASAVPRSGNVDDAVRLYQNRLFLNDVDILNDVDNNPFNAAAKREFLKNRMHHEMMERKAGRSPFRHFL
jgi:hypothetical protein